MLRAGRLTPAQRRALDELWPLYGVDLAGPQPNFDAIFGRKAPLVIEVGFGNGETLIADAQTHPEQNFLGIEVHTPGIGRLLRQLELLEPGNVRVVNHDAAEVLRDHIAPHAVDAINIFFPDPWPKKRHHKRRLIQPQFLRLVAKVLRPGGQLHIATDWKEYAEHIEQCLTDAGHLDLLQATETGRHETKFERRGRKLGHGVWDFVARRRCD